jgi:uncharacterized protein
MNFFQSATANRHGAHLIFTTHDATLLGSIDGDDVLKRDQVWFTSKHDDGACLLAFQEPRVFPSAEASTWC